MDRKSRNIHRPVCKLIAGLLAVATLALLLCSCGKKEEDKEDNSVIGEWRFDIQNSDLSYDDLVTLFSSSSGNDSDATLLFEVLGVDGMKEITSSLFGAISFVFREDNTVAYRLDPQRVRDGMLKMVDSLFDAQAKMDLETAAKVNGMTAAQLQAQLDSAGKTWPEFCELGKVSARQSLSSSMTDEAIAKSFGENMTYKNGVYESESSEYLLEDSQLSFIDKDKQKSGAWTISRKGDTITIVKAISKKEDSAAFAAFCEGMRLTKVGS